MLADPQLQVNDPRERALLLSALYNAQEQFGWLSPQAIQHVAGQLNLSPGQVHSTASFYTMFKLQPQGQYRIQVCEGLSCYLVGGAEPIIDYIKRRLNIINGDTSPDGKFTLEIVQCLAACDLAPAVIVNDELYGNISTDKIGDFLSELLAKA